MLDNVGLRLEAVSMDNYNQIIEKIGVCRPQESEAMHVKWHNMRLTYYPNAGRLVLINSLHKLYNSLSGSPHLSNANDFHLTDCNALTDWLSMLYFDRDPDDFKVTTKFEFGMNINTGHTAPFDIVRRWLSCNGNEFYASPPKKGRPILKASYHSDYKVKGYDKGLESGIHCGGTNNILRYEVVVSEIRKVRKILCYSKDYEVSLKDINDHVAWYNLYCSLIKTYDTIRKVPLIDAEMAEEDIFKLHGYISPFIAEDLCRLMGRNKYSRWRAKARKLYDRLDKNELNIHNLLRSKLEEKFRDLYN